ncbi:hypothetical protein PINS_up005230 [Pythium insidiosum]|nr:hypothetical protein PINS_up005230 [Pythium insidiosum]
MIADLLTQRGSVTGVDFSRSRLGACKQLVHKYGLLQSPTDATTTATAAASESHDDGNDTDAVATPPSTTSLLSWRCRLFHADGRTFNVGPEAEWTRDADAMEVVVDSLEIAARDPKAQSRKRKNKSARGREQRKRRTLEGDSGNGKGSSEGGPHETSHGMMTTPSVLYDKVLVDAECTHDGSIKHLQKLDSLDAWTTYVERHLSDAQVQRILALQAALLRNGFRLLRAGGTLVYSTCSLSLQQNEAIVSAFLRETSDAALVPIDTDGVPCEVCV